MDWDVYNLKEVVNLKEEAEKVCSSDYPDKEALLNEVCGAALDTLDLVKEFADEVGDLDPINDP